MPSHLADDRLPFADDIDREIARMVVAGAPNKAIASRTGMALGTIKWRLHRMYGRLGVHTRTTFAISVRDLLNGTGGAS